MGRKSKALPERRGERSVELQARDEGEAQARLGRGGDRAAVLPCPTQNGETSGRAVARRIRPEAAPGSMARRANGKHWRTPGDRGSLWRMLPKKQKSRYRS